ncbi:MAG TPA: Ig-like domain-containing protein, partial [Tepidisphaeraceae bacterium]|nr:Ig-like domain-containing protein [Tepidisphaeraceae bacterium]
MFAKKAAVTASARRRSSIRRAVVPAVLEALEERRLMSAALSLTNLDGLPFNDRLIFNKVQNPDPKFPNVTHDTSSVKLTNTGDATLSVSALTVTGPWVFVNGPTTFPLSIPVGGSTTLTLKFTQSTLPRHVGNQTNFTTNPNGGASITGSLVIQSNDPAHVNTPVTLAGYWQSKSENNAEPNLTTIVNLVSGYTTNIGGSPDLPEPGNTPTRVGDEVASDFWQSANAAQPVVVRQLAGFHTQGNVVHTFWFTGGSTGIDSTVSHQLFSSKPLEGQSLLPHSAAGTFANGSFTTSAPFGLRVDNEYSLNSLNNQAGGGHHFRFYPLLDRTGTVVPNTWIVGMDYAVIQTENFDFQDNVYVVSNMMPAQVQTVVPPPTPTNFTATNAANPVLNWTGVSYGKPFGYKVYRSTSASGPFTLISGASPIASSTTTFTDNASPPAGTTLFYRLTAVDLASSSESVPATTTANAPAANTPVAVDDSFDTTTNATNVTEDLTANDSGLGVVRHITIIGAPNHGGTVVPDTNDTGLVTYTPAAGFTGVETFTYQVSNGGTQSNTATVTFNVSQPVVPSPALPIAGDQNFQVLAANTYTLTPTNVTDAEGNAITPASITIVTNPTRGTVTTNGGTIVYTPDPTKTAGANFVGSDFFAYDVTDAQGHTSTNHGVITLNVGVEFGTNTGKRSLSYTDATGNKPVATLNLGVADVFFNGNGQFTTDSHGRITVGSFSGASNLTIANVKLTNTTAASTLAMVTPNRGAFSVGGIADSGTIGRIIAPNANVSGGSVANTTIDLGGDGILLLGQVSTSIINIGTGFTAGPAVVVGVVTDSLLNADGNVRLIKAVSWTNTENANLGIAAVSLNTLLITGNATTAGDFEPNLSLSGNLNVASIAGTLDKGGWDINGNANVIVAKSVGAGWSGVVSGTLNNMVVRTGGMPAPLTVTNLNTLNVLAGDITGGI